MFLAPYAPLPPVFPLGRGGLRIINVYAIFGEGGRFNTSNRVLIEARIDEEVLALKHKRWDEKAEYVYQGAHRLGRSLMSRPVTYAPCGITLRHVGAGHEITDVHLMPGDYEMLDICYHGGASRGMSRHIIVPEPLV